MKIVISNPSLILDVQIAVAKEQSRYNLMGFCVEKASEGIILVSTDGHRMIVIHDPQGQIDDDCRPIIKLPKNFLAEVKKMKGDVPTVKIEGNTKENTATLTDDDRVLVEVHDVLIDGKYPEWHRALPVLDKKKPLVPAMFNADYLGQFKSLSLSRESALVKLYGNDESGPYLVKIQYRDDIFGVLMPCKNFTEPTFPAWLDKK